MADKTLNLKVLQVVNTTAEWLASSAATTTPMSKGLLGIETTTDGKTHAKVGDGVSLWETLPYVTNPTVEAKIAALTGVSRVKGVLATKSELDAKTTGNVVGDVWFVGTSDPEDPTDNDYQEYIWVEQEVEVADPENEGETITQTVGKWELLGSVNGTYTLPIASSETLGGIKVGANLEINDQTGVLSAAIPVFQGATAAVAPADPEDPEDEGTPAQAGVAGLVPAPAAADLGKVLGASGQWVELPDTSDLESRVDEIEENYISEADLVAIQCTL